VSLAPKLFTADIVVSLADLTQYLPPIGRPASKASLSLAGCGSMNEMGRHRVAKVS